jgi:hypothetical protein
LRGARHSILAPDSFTNVGKEIARSESPTVRPASPAVFHVAGRIRVASAFVKRRRRRYQ